MPADQDPRTGHWFFRKKVTLPDGTGRRISGVPTNYSQPDTRLGAEEAERIAIARLRESGSTAPAPTAPSTAGPTAKSVPSVKEFSDVWYAKSEGDDKPSTIAKKRTTIDQYLLPRFGHLRLDEVTFAAVEAWRLDMLKTLKPSSVYRIMTDLRTLLGYAHKLDVLDRLPKWPTQKIPEHKARFLTFVETDRLIAAAEPIDPWKAMITIAARTGLRHGELTALRWVDVDLAGGKISVIENYVDGHTGTPKSGHGREVPLSNDAIKALRAVQHTRGPLVFCTRSGGHLLHHVNDHALRVICRRAGVSPIGWHRLRHTFAPHLAMRNVSLKTIQELLGHADMEMTMRYAHLMPEVRRDAVLLLDGAPPVRSPTSRPSGD